jgi:hypothetical protein
MVYLKEEVTGNCLTKSTSATMVSGRILWNRVAQMMLSVDRMELQINMFGCSSHSTSVDVSYVASQAHGIVNVPFHWEYSPGM